MGGSAVGRSDDDSPRKAGERIVNKDTIGLAVIGCGTIGSIRAELARESRY